jgi:hypothetical protein
LRPETEDAQPTFFRDLLSASKQALFSGAHLSKHHLKQGRLSAPKTASGGEVGEDFVAGGQEGFLAGGEPARGEPRARILPGEVTIKVEGHDGIIELPKGVLSFLKAAKKFLDRPLGPKRSDELRRVTQPFDALAQLMALVVPQRGEAGVVAADFLFEFAERGGKDLPEAVDGPKGFILRVGRLEQG